MGLLTPGYWPSTYWPSNYWPDDYWPEYGTAALPPIRRISIDNQKPTYRLKTNQQKPTYRLTQEMK